MLRKVVITGMGCVTPIGVGAKAFSRSLREGKVGIGPITRFDASVFKARLAAEVTEDFSEWLDPREAKRMDRFCRLGVAAAHMALLHSGLDLEKTDRERFGAIISAGIGGLETLEDEKAKLLAQGPGRVSPLLIPMIIANMAAGHVAIRYGLNGPTSSIITACASSTDAIGEAFRLIRWGQCDVMLAGGAEAAITPLGVAGFINIKALSRAEDPLRASIPFDRERDGFIMGEGGGALLLESLEHATARGADIIAEVAGYGATTDGYHITAPEPEATQPARAMALALSEAGLSPEDVGYINAHGTSTPPNDPMETKAIRRVFGDRRVPVSSTKSMTGHLLGAAGGVEAIACALALSEGFLPPTMGYREPDPECDLDVVPNAAREAKINAALTNSFGFGGHNACLALKRYDGGM